MSTQKGKLKAVPKPLLSFGFTPLTEDQLELKRLQDQVDAQAYKMRIAAEAHEKRRLHEEKQMQQASKNAFKKKVYWQLQCCQKRMNLR